MYRTRSVRVPGIRKGREILGNSMKYNDFIGWLKGIRSWKLRYKIIFFAFLIVGGWSMVVKQTSEPTNPTTYSVKGDVVMGNKTVNNYVPVIMDREIREKFPDELTFYGSEEIDFNSSKKMLFESSQAQARVEISIGKIYLKGDKFYIIFSVNLFDKKNNTDWIDLHAETEVSRDKIAVARTDRFDLHLHIIETELTKAKVSIGIEMVNRGHIIKNFVIKGNAINFE